MGPERSVRPRTGPSAGCECPRLPEAPCEAIGTAQPRRPWCRSCSSYLASGQCRRPNNRPLPPHPRRAAGPAAACAGLLSAGRVRADVECAEGAPSRLWLYGAGRQRDRTNSGVRANRQCREAAHSSLFALTPNPPVGGLRGELKLTQPLYGLHSESPGVPVWRGWGANLTPLEMP